MTVIENIGTISSPMAECPWSSGGTPAIRKKACTATHSESAGATELNARRYHGSRHRREIMKQSTARARVAGAGPNMIADAMKKVSATEIRASIDARLTLNGPMSIARPANSSHPNGRGVWTAARIDCTSTPAPTARRIRTYRRSDADGAVGADGADAAAEFVGG